MPCPAAGSLKILITGSIDLWAVPRWVLSQQSVLNVSVNCKLQHRRCLVREEPVRGHGQRLPLVVGRWWVYQHAPIMTLPNSTVPSVQHIVGSLLSSCAVAIWGCVNKSSATSCGLVLRFEGHKMKRYGLEEYILALPVARQ